MASDPLSNAPRASGAPVIQMPSQAPPPPVIIPPGSAGGPGMQGVPGGPGGPGGAGGPQLAPDAKLGGSPASPGAGGGRAAQILLNAGLSPDELQNMTPERFQVLMKSGRIPPQAMQALMQDPEFLKTFKISCFKCVRFSNMNPFLVSILIAPAMLFYAMDTAGLNVSVPLISASLNLDKSIVQWLVHSEILICTFIGPMAPKIGERFGITRIFILANAIFSLFTLLLSFAYKSFPLMVVFRVLASIGLALMLPLATPTAFMLVSRARLPITLAINSTLVPLGTLLNSLISGALTSISDTSWSYIFLMIGCLGCAFTVILGVALPTKFPRGNPKAKIDFLGALYIGLGLALIVFSFTLLSMDDIPSWVCPITLIAGIGCLVGFYFWSYSRTASTRRCIPIAMPLIARQVFNRSYSLVIIMAVLGTLAVYGEQFFRAYIWLQVYNQPRSLNGVLMAIPSLFTCAFSFVISLIYKKMVARWLIVIYQALYAAAVLAAAFTLGTHVAVTMIFVIITTVTFLAFGITFQSFSMANAPRQYAPSIGTMNTLSQNLGHSLGVGICVTIQNSLQRSGSSLATSIMWTYVFCGCVAIITIPMGYFIGMVKADRGKVGFSERALNKTHTFEENLLNNGEMVEVVEDEEAASTTERLAPPEVYIMWGM